MKNNKPGRIISIVLFSIIICLVIILVLSPEILITKKDVLRTTIATTSVKPDLNILENINSMREQVEKIKLSDKDVDIVIFGEAILSKYDLDTMYLVENSLVLDGTEMKTITNIAKDFGVYLCFGAITRENNEFFNSQLIIDREGELILVHHKSNLTSYESAILQRGKDPISFFYLDKIRTGVTICYDIQHKDFNGLIRENHPVLLLHSLADPGDPEFVTGSSFRKANCWYVSSNRYGRENDLNFNGFISMCNPVGSIKEIKYDQPGYMIKDFYIPVSESEIKWSVRKFYNSTLRVFHFIKHRGKVIDYIKWDKEMHKQKNLPVPFYETNLFLISLFLIIIIPLIIVAIKYARLLNSKILKVRPSRRK